MAEATVVACLERTGKLLKWEGNLLSGVISQVHDVRLQLKMLQSFLKDADTKRRREDRVFRWVREVREVALRMEDVLETYAVEIESRRKDGQVKQLVTRCCDIFGECITLHKLDPEMKSIKKKLTNLAERKESLELEESGESTNAEQDIHIVSEAKFEADFVGREVEIKKVVSHLRNKTQFRQVVSIWGMGGLGKTTLAGKVYKDVRSHFDASAWVSLTQNFDPLKVLRKIFKDLLKDKEAGEIETMKIEKLQQNILEVLKGKNCLVVLDDIWSVDHWKKLELAFPPYGEDESGTKILLTTRKQQVTELGFLYRLEGPTPDEGWNLLSKKAFPTRDNHDCDPYAEDRVDPEKEKIGREIVEKCQGLPLAISAIGGVLKGKRALNDWRLVKLDISSSLITGEDSDEYSSVRRILATSYDDLSFRYKQLFLYLGNYEEDVEIRTEVLYQRWIAEGMISSGVKQAKGLTLMNVADSYLNELAERSLVLVIPVDYESWVKFDKCRLHDLMRDLCVIKRKEEDILNLTAIRDAHSESFDFQAVVGELSALANYVYDGSDSRVPLDKYEFGQLRSLAFAGHHELPQIVQNLQQFKLVRVLSLENFEFEYGKLPQELSYLIHLRYLCLYGCRLNELPTFIGDFRYLETLDLRVRDDNFMIPNVLRNLERLKHLYLPYPGSVCINPTSGKLNFDGLGELEMLWNISGSKCEMDDLVKLVRLQVIENVLVESPQQLEDALNVIASKQFTSLRVEHVDLMSSSEASGLVVSSNYLTQLLECSSLTELKIGSDVGGSFPKEINNHNFSPTLVRIMVEGCKYEDDPMPLLEMLTNLRILILDKDSYLGKEIVCSAIGFPRLTSLGLEDLEYLETWSLEKGAMPNLVELRISGCVELEMLPDALEFLTFLEEIRIKVMSEAFNDRIRGTTNNGEGQDFHKIGHVSYISVDGVKIDL